MFNCTLLSAAKIVLIGQKSKNIDPLKFPLNVGISAVSLHSLEELFGF